MTEEEFRYQMWKEAKRFVDLIEEALKDPEPVRHNVPIPFPRGED
jgi:hypothetical protein